MTSKVVSVPLLKKAERMLSDARRTMGLEDFPYTTKLSMAPLIRHWQRHSLEGSEYIKAIGGQVDDYVNNHISILQPYNAIDDLLDEHAVVMDLLFSGVFPIVLAENLLGYAAPPFIMKPFYVTQGMQELLADTRAEVSFQQFGEFDKMPFSIRAGVIILDKYYGLKLDRVLPFLFSLRYEGSNMEQFFKTTSILDYLDVKTKKEPDEISQQKVDYLLKHMDDEALWLETFSPDVFYFEGFFMAIMNDVTEVETMSRLRKKLLEPNSLLEEANARIIANLTRMYLSLPDVEVGIAALDYPPEGSVAHRYKINYPIVSGLQRYLSTEDRSDSVYMKACKLNQMEVVSDLAKINDPGRNERALLEMGFRSLMVIPLRDHQKNIIGIMELASPDPYTFTHIKKLKLKELLPLYDAAIDESRQSVENRIRSVIQEHYTNIHPSILWKFTETAFNFLEDQEESGEMASLEPIVFNDVHPLFGQIDINSSTAIRNRAVASDLKQNLELLVTILDATYSYSKFHLLKKYLSEASNRLEKIKREFNTADETLITELLQENVHPILKEIREHVAVLSPLIDDYFAQLDPKLEMIYVERRKYDRSLKKINSIIANHLDEQEIINQRILPHYFEKYKTDGLEYTIYIGQSMLQHDHFTIHHLRNLRLWQLKSMIEIYHTLEAARPSFPMDMTVSFLIIAFGNTLSIKFRMEEKHFDVEGSYNLQYQVLKKRVDKAYIVDTQERLTQPNKIAIVYLQEKAKEEYLEYLQFLIEEKMLESEIEDLELEPVQGVQGVKALRIPFKNRNAGV